MCMAFALLCLLPSQAIAFTPAEHGNAYLSTLIQQAKERKLDQHPLWLALLHFNHTDNANRFSYAISNSFFIANDGRQHPKKELIATLVSLFEEHSELKSTPCRFPARYQWLIQQLSIDASKIAKHPVCQQYINWREASAAKSVTLVFPGSYMNAPSSVFGHTLLRIDNSKDDPSHLLSHAISFAAKIPDGTGALAYAIGGIAGAFPGRYQHALYHQKIKEYGRIENRDIWEYKLNLNQQELNRLMQHLWEIKDIDFRYFFAKENCSFRLLELLEVARSKQHLTDYFPMYAIPSDTIRMLTKNGFVSSVQYRPSAATRLHAEINDLNRHEQHLALLISRHDTALSSTDFLKLTDERKAKIIQLAYRYLKFKQIESWKKADSPLPYHLIQQLQRYPTVTEPTITQPVRPDMGHKTGRLKLSSGYENSSYAQLGLRPLYHDFTDNQTGYTTGSEIVFLNTELRWQRKSIHLHHMDILKMTSLRPGDSFLQPLSWRITAELDRSSFHSGYHLTPRISGAVGYTYQILPHATVSILPSVRVNLNPVHTEHGIVQIGGSLEYLLQKTWGTTYILGTYHKAIGKPFSSHQIKFSQTLAINKDQDFRIGVACKERCRRNNLDFNVGFAIFF